MSIVHLSAVPHSPILLGLENTQKDEALLAFGRNLAKIEEELYLAKPEIVVIISPHASIYKDSFSISAHTTMRPELSKFGDIKERKFYAVATELAARLAYRGKTDGYNLQLTSDENLDYGSSIPLISVAKSLNDFKILSIGPSAESTDKLFAFGEFLKDRFSTEQKRIAVILSIDLAHGHDQTDKSHLSGEYDQVIRQSLNEKSITAIKTFGESRLILADQCSLGAVAIFIGIAAELGAKWIEHDYVRAAGLGLLTGEYAMT